MTDKPDTSNMIPVRFHGSAREYFGVWIVNVLLSIVTLGVYSAWAKVRNKKYFLGNTTIDRRAFDYHATGKQILIGRILIVAILIALAIIGQISEPVASAVGTGIGFASPLLINRGLRFNAAMTSWSNVRFRFEIDDYRALHVFYLNLLLSLLTLWLAFPYAARAISRYTIGRHSLGTHGFSFDSSIRPFYVALLATAPWALLGGYLLYVSFTSHLLVVFVAIPILLSSATVYAAFTRNAIFEGIVLEHGHRIHSTISPTKLILIIMTNVLVIIFSAGLLIPWARVRVMKYLCEHTWVEPNGSLDEFVADLQESTTAVGDAFMDIESVEVGIST